ncbi:amino acid adenylation domain-containing protein (plasmid) [Streptomyces sp. NBC_00868]|uniref:amino acid adenylation domain-containing protein n=1 Tax=Streptomyces sp. NBC_00868 TaxID=2903683 RepID=UPI00386B9981|nr:amino acid adenylation domain-containing protein [Streptomyces sp. NBC_00868]
MGASAVGSRFLSRIRRADGSDLIPRRGEGVREVPLSFAQQRLWFLDQLDPGSAEYVVPAVFRVRGPLDMRALNAALDALVARHEVLRTRFEVGAGGDPVQIIGDPWHVTIEHLNLTEDADPMEAGRAAVESFGHRPFDLGEGRLLRAMTVAVAPDDHLFALAMHHVVVDGWSMGVLVEELRCLYAAGNASALPELPIQYADFALWQQRQVSGEALARDLDYWQTRLAGLETLELPTDRPRPRIRSGAGATHTFTVPAVTANALRELAARNNASLFMTGLTVFQLVLARWSGQSDIAVGVPIAGRNRAELEGLVGFFVNTLVMRANLDSDAAFTDILDQVRGTTLDAYTHQDLPFERLVEELAPERDLGRNPLIQVGFSVEGVSGDPREISGVTMEEVAVSSRVSKLDLALVLAEEEDGSLSGEATFATELFDASTIERLTGHFTTALATICHDPHQKLGEVEILTSTERDQIFTEFNDTTVDYADDTTIHRLFERQAALTPDTPAVVHHDTGLTYRQLNERANRLAHHLIGQGVGTDTLVGVCLEERSVDMITALLAVLKAGGAYIPLDPANPGSRLALMLEETEAPLVLTDSRLIGHLRHTSTPTVSLDRLDLDAYPPSDPTTSTGARDLAYVIYTSGSTGTPKGVQIEHRSICRLLTNNWVNTITPGDIVAQSLNFAWDSFGFECWPTLTCGATMVVLGPQALAGSESFAEALERHSISTCVLPTPLFNQYLVERPDLFRNLKSVVYGGEAGDRAVADALMSSPYAPERLAHLYGPTEATIIATGFVVGEDRPDTTSMPIGRPISNTQVLVVDRHGGLAPIGVPGELLITGPGLGRGYLKRPELTADRFVTTRLTPEPTRAYRTGDLVRWLPDGTIEFLGRIDNQVKIRGLRIELGEIEATLTNHPDIALITVIVREDIPGDKRLVAYYSTHTTHPLTSDDLRSHCRTRLPDYMVPNHFVHLAKLPTTPNGKVDRRALPAPNTYTSTTHAPPRTPTETTIVAIWADVLNAPDLGIHDNFFDLGGHSLSATRAANRISRALGTDIPVRQIFNRPTVAGLAAGLGNCGETISVIPRRGEGVREVPLSFAQQRLWFLDQLDPGSAEYVVPAVFRVRGPLDMRALNAALDALVARHEVLRTRFEVGAGGDPVQIIGDPWHVTIEHLNLTEDADPMEAGRAAVESFGHRPFDLGEGRLLRAMTVAVAPDDHLFALAMHHVVVDGWSMGVLVEELRCLYAAGNASALPELPIQYADFALWQQRQVSGEALARDLDYWQTRLAGLETLELPTDRPRPRIRSGAGATHTFTVPAVTANALRELAARNNASLFMTGLTVFQLVLARWSGQSDIAVGVPIAGRNRAELEGLVGFFVNTLVMRANLDSDAAFTDILDQVRGTTLDAYTHQDLPFERLVEELAPERDLGRNPLIQVVFALQNVLVHGWALPGTAVEVLPTNADTSKFDLAVFLAEEEDGSLSGEATFATELFDASTIERLTGHFTTALATICHDPHQKLGEVEILTSTERDQIFTEFNDTTVDYADDTTIHRLFERQAALTPDTPAVVHHDTGLTYRQLNERANRLAHHLIGQGVGTDTLVGVCLEERSVDMITALLAVLKAGGAYIPLDPANPGSRLALMLEETEAPLVLTDSRLIGHLRHTSTPTVSLDRLDLDAYPPSDPTTSTGARDLAYVIYTSGSTGTPKGVQIEHRSICRLLTNNWVNTITPGDIVAQTGNHCFDAFTYECWGALVTGATLAIVDTDELTDSDELAAAFRQYGVTVTWLTAPLFNQHLVERPDLVAGMKRVLYGGEAVDRAVADALMSSPFAPDSLVNGYGPTETTVFAVCFVVGEDRPDTTSMPIGRPISNTQVLVVDRHGGLAPIGVPGELLITGPGLGRGYLKRPELTADRFVTTRLTPEPTRAYRTGDLVRWLPDGTIEFLGRIDNQVKIRGLRIELGEIEATLTNHPDIALITVIVREDIPGDKRLVAYYSTHTTHPLTSDDLRSHCRTRLPDYMVPNHFVHLAKLPTTPNGKVDRRALPAPNTYTSTTHAPPRTPTETTIVAIWADVLNAPDLGIHDNFFDLGGHSLSATRAANRISRALGTDIPVRQILQWQTAAELGASIEEGRSAKREILYRLSSEEPDPERPNLFCVHPSGGTPYAFGQLARQLPEDCTTYGIQAVGMDRSELPLRDIGDIAARYWKAVKSVQPEGPYYLLGWSLGGIIAHEMARQGADDVARVFLVEPPVHGPRLSKRLLPGVERYARATELWERGQEADPAAREAYAAELRRVAEPLEVPAESVGLDEWLPYETLGLLLDAMLRHSPSPSTAPAVLFVSDDVTHSQEGSVVNERDLVEYLDHWAALYDLPPLVEQTPGDHASMLAELPGIEKVASVVRTVLSSAPTEPGVVTTEKMG